jgi:hypothetical protein
MFRISNSRLLESNKARNPRDFVQVCIYAELQACHSCCTADVLVLPVALLDAKWQPKLMTVPLDDAGDRRSPDLKTGHLALNFANIPTFQSNSFKVLLKLLLTAGGCKEWFGCRVEPLTDDFHRRQTSSDRSSSSRLPVRPPGRIQDTMRLGDPATGQPVTPRHRRHPASSTLARSSFRRGRAMGHTELLILWRDATVAWSRP